MYVLFSVLKTFRVLTAFGALSALKAFMMGRDAFTLQQAAQYFMVDIDVLEPLLINWKQRGKIDKSTSCCMPCGGNCGGCPVGEITLYRWINVQADEVD